MTRRKIVISGLLYGIVFAVLLFASQAQEVKLRMMDNEIFVEDKFGNLRQLTKDGERKENVALNATAYKIVYHGKFNSYVDPPEPPIFTVLDVKAEEAPKKIPVYWRSRYIDKVEWINERLVGVKGEGLAIIDVKQGRQIHYIPSAYSFISPDQKKIVFEEPRYPIYGPKPPEEDSDSIALALMAKGLPAKKEGEVLYSPAMTIYPKVSYWDGSPHEAPFDDLYERHWLKSHMSWSPDSHRVAFVEYQKRTFWVVVLKITTSGEEVKVEHKRVDLGKEFDDMDQERPRVLTSKVEWTSDDRAIKVASRKATYIVDVENNKITRPSGSSSNKK